MSLSLLQVRRARTCSSTTCLTILPMLTWPRRSRRSGTWSAPRCSSTRGPARARASVGYGYGWRRFRFLFRFRCFVKSFFLFVGSCSFCIFSVACLGICVAAAVVYSVHKFTCARACVCSRNNIRCRPDEMLAPHTVGSTQRQNGA